MAGDAVGEIGDALQRAAYLDERQHEPEVYGDRPEQRDVVLAVAVYLEFVGIHPLFAARHLTGEFRIVVQIGLAGLLELREHQPPHLADLLAQERQLFFRMFHCPGRCALSG